MVLGFLSGDCFLARTRGQGASITWQSLVSVLAPRYLAIPEPVFGKLDSRDGEYFPEYATNFFPRPLRLNKSIYEKTKFGKLFADELTNWLIDEVGFN